MILVNGTEVNGIYKCQIKDLAKKDPKISNSICANERSPNTQGVFNLASASYYTNVPSASVDSIKELVRFFHEIWNHASMELMCSIVKNKLVLNLPETLTEKAIRKHFPNCNACPIGNLQQRPTMSLPADRYLGSNNR